VSALEATLAAANALKASCQAARGKPHAQPASGRWLAALYRRASSSLPLNSRLPGGSPRSKKKGQRDRYLRGVVDDPHRGPCPGAVQRGRWQQELLNCKDRV